MKQKHTLFAAGALALALSAGAIPAFATGSPPQTAFVQNGSGVQGEEFSNGPIWSAESAQEYLDVYGAFGLTYDAEAGRLFFDGREIILFMDVYADNTFEKYFSLGTLTPSGRETVRVITERGADDTLTGLRELTDAEYEKLRGAGLVSRPIEGDTADDGSYVTTAYAAESAQDSGPVAGAYSTAVSSDITLDPDLTAEYARFGITLNREGDVLYNGVYTGFFWDEENYCCARDAEGPFLIVERDESGKMTGMREVTAQEVYDLTGLIIT